MILSVYSDDNQRRDTRGERVIPTAGLVPGVVVDEDQLMSLYRTVRTGAVECELWATSGRKVVVHIERTTDGKVVQMTVGGEEVDCRPLVIALGALLLGAIKDTRSYRTLRLAVLDGLAAGFGVTVGTELEGCIG